ncbi:MAG: PH domain-containing protein [Actinomycetales bacterium]|nr:PH domain-containing protein [Actinomycetales bacterium]
MGYPQKLLSDGEVIKFEMKPHWRALIWPILLLIIVAGLSAFLTTITAAWAPFNLIFAAIGLIIIIIWAFIPFLRWVTTQYVFTNRRIIIRRGLLTKQGRDMPLSKVNNVTFEVSFLGRILNFGRLIIQSAGEDSGLDIDDVPNVEVIQRDVYQLYEEDDARRRGVSGDTGHTQVLPSDGT